MAEEQAAASSAELAAESTSNSAAESSSSMADTIRQTLNTIKERDGGLPTGEEESTAASTAKPVEKAEARADGRDDKGRFKTSNTTDTTAATAATATEAAPVVEKALPRWSKQALEHWDKLPPEVQQAALARDKAFFDGIESYKAPATQWAKLEQALGAENINYLRAKAQGDEVAGLRGLVQLEQWANQKPLEFIQWFAKNTGINLAGFGQPAEGQQAQPVIDPTIAQMRQQMQAFEEREQKRATQEYESRMHGIEQDLARFQQEQDKAGYLDDWTDSPSGPRPGPFSTKFVQFVQSGNSYADAYAMAKAATPEIREAEAAQLRAEAVEAERKAIAAREARRAASVNVTSRGSLPPTQPVGTMADTIRAEYRRLTSG